MLPYYQRMSHVICKVGYPSFNARVSEHRMLSFQCNAWFDEECKTQSKCSSSPTIKMKMS